MPYFLLIIGFVLVIKGATFLVNGGSALARRCRISDLVIGLTVIAFGTSLPELFVNIFASVQGNVDVAIGNILGSNMVNILFVLGLSSVLFPLHVDRGTVWKQIPFCLLAVLILAVLMNDQLIDGSSLSTLTRSDGIVLLAFFVIFLYYSLSAAAESREIFPCDEKQKSSLGKPTAEILSGLILLILGGKLTNDGAVGIATGLGLSQSLVGLTLVAVGTSIPELATSVVAAMKKNPQIAIGNVVGSNIFNIFFILGVSSIVRPLPMKSSMNIDISVLASASLFLFICMFTGHRRVLDRWEGAVMIGIYIGYVVFLVIRG